MKAEIICSSEAQNEALNTFYLSVDCQENVPDIDLFISVIYLFTVKTVLTYVQDGHKT